MTTSLESVQVPRIAPAHDGHALDEEIRPGGSRIVFPRAMEARFRPVLAELYDETQARDDVVALLVFGSAQRGESRPGSDLDLCAVTEGDQKWIQSRMVQGVEVQMKGGPVRIWRGLIEKQNPVITEIFATGELLFDKTGAATELQRFAEECFRAGPKAKSAAEIETGRYALTNMIRDLEDLPGDSVPARMLSGAIVVDALKSWCACQSLWATRKPAVMLRSLRQRDPSIAEKIDSFYDSPSPARAVAVADAVLETIGGRLYEFSLAPELA